MRCPICPHHSGYEFPNLVPHRLREPETSRTLNNSPRLTLGSGNDVFGDLANLPELSEPEIVIGAYCDAKRAVAVRYGELGNLALAWTHTGVSQGEYLSAGTERQYEQDHSCQDTSESSSTRCLHQSVCCHPCISLKGKYTNPKRDYEITVTNNCVCGS